MSSFHSIVQHFYSIGLYVKKKGTISSRTETKKMSAAEKQRQKELRLQEKQKQARLRASLPKKIIPVKCSDKGFQERWYRGRDLLNFPHSFSMVLAGPPSSGKSTLIKNILLRADPPFQKVIVCHFDKNGSDEWSDLGNEEDGVTIVDEIPDAKLINPDKKKCALILEVQY